MKDRFDKPTFIEWFKQKNKPGNIFDMLQAMQEFERETGIIISDGETMHYMVAAMERTAQ